MPAIGQRILLLEGFFSACRSCRISRSIASPRWCTAREQLQHARSALRAGTPIDVFLKFNTGMNRLGFAAAELRRVLDAPAARCPASGKIVLMTHFSDAEGAQRHRLADARIRGARSARLGLCRVSLANSAALAALSATRAATGCGPASCSMARRPFGRCERADAGAEAGDDAGERNHRRPATQAPATPSATAASFRADRAMRIGVVACGYADGYPRHAPQRHAGAGRRACARRTVGPRVDGHAVRRSDRHARTPAWAARSMLWGEGLPVEEVAAAAGTVSYELLCALAPRVPVVERWTEADGEGENDLHLHRMRRPDPEMAGPVPALQRLEHAGGDHCGAGDGLALPGRSQASSRLQKLGEVEAREEPRRANRHRRTRPRAGRRPGARRRWC